MKIVLNISFLLLGLLVGLCNVLAQTGVPTIRWNVESARNGAAVVGTNTIMLQERARTYISGNSTLQTASVSISRSSTVSTNPINIRYTCEYYTAENFNSQTLAYSGLKPLPNISTDVRLLPDSLSNETQGCGVPVATPAFPPPTPIAINGFQGDLNPNIVLGSQAVFNAAPANNPGTIVFGAGVTTATVNFTARFSDQVFLPSKRTAGIQGVRVAIIRLLPSVDTPAAYQIEQGKDSIKVMLLDPFPVPPVLNNGILNQIVEVPQGNVPRIGGFSLEGGGCEWQVDNTPSSAFYDDNYDILSYTATSERPDWISVRIARFDPTVPASSMLVYQVFPSAPAGARVRITVRASDGTVQSDGQARLASTQFFINVVNSLTTSVALTQEPSIISVSPNPAADMLTVSGVAKFSGQMLIRIMDSAGRIMLTKSSLATAGASYKETVDVRNIASGMYLVEVENGGIKQVQKVIKQ